ncbi:MAG: hypothetical protein RQ758_05680 [Methanomicrobiaceae archaeon]|nr:hypothetical protein [Methanomicrobiaceae archaeon]
MDRRLSPVGKLVDLFGNIQSPYAVVKCFGACTNRVGEKLFAK